ncbi:MAG TPA: hypothetical protein VKU83_09405, partial [Puia sp.]|nr:hypothetical protein [Puia sp.]
MSFIIDQQTLDDLDILSKQPGASIYLLFNRTFTRGGAAVLEEMFRFPLTDPTRIRKRGAIIAYFSATTLFPFDT